MKIPYENTLFSCSLTHSLEKMLVKAYVKRKIGRFFGKPYQKDPFLAFAENTLNDTPIVIDVGANIGMTTLPLAKKFPRGTFIAVEPHPTPSKKFLENTNLNCLTNVSLVQAAIAPARSLAKIFTCPTNSGGHRITGFNGRGDVHADPLEGVVVPTLTLTELFAYFQLLHCDLLKIDVEGVECQVLESLGPLLHPSCIPLIVVEYGVEGLRHAKRSGQELLEIVLAKGYHCVELGKTKPIKTAKDLPLLPDFAVTDLVFVKG